QRDQLENKGDEIIDQILMNGPGAVSETKRVLFETSGLYINDALAARLAEGHSRQRQTEEASEGLRSFHEKRKAAWYPQ
ncbi:MAG: hypothetical protein WD624_05015, partial [Rhodospirillales bacterium]